MEGLYVDDEDDGGVDRNGGRGDRGEVEIGAGSVPHSAHACLSSLLRVRTPSRR